MLKRNKGVVCLAGLLLFSGLAQAADSEAADSKAIAVRAQPFAELATQPLIDAPARVLSLNDSQIEAEINATVAAIDVRVGDTVEAGAPLMRLACEDKENALAQAQAAHTALSARRDFADYQLGRARSLIKSGNISDEQLRQRRADALALAAELNSASAAQARAQRDVARCQITAPFTAVVMQRLIGVGEKAAPGKRLLRLLDMGALEVSAQVPAGNAESLQQASRLLLRIDGHNYPLQLRSLLPALDPLSRSREVRLEFSAESAPPGASGRLIWQSDQGHLPADYILRRDGRYGVFVLEGAQARFHAIDAAREGSAAPLELPADSLIITEGRYTLRHGDAVRRVE